LSLVHGRKWDTAGTGAPDQFSIFLKKEDNLTGCLDDVSLPE